MRPGLLLCTYMLCIECLAGGAIMCEFSHIPCTIWNTPIIDFVTKIITCVTYRFFRSLAKLMRPKMLLLKRKWSISTNNMWVHPSISGTMRMISEFPQLSDILLTMIYIVQLTQIMQCKLTRPFDDVLAVYCKHKFKFTVDLIYCFNLLTAVLDSCHS